MTPYRGRFAPSPTGPLHFGSLVAALGSFLDARNNQGEWLVRVEDLDPPREIPGAADHILRCLDALGLHWDGPVVYQSRRNHHYAEALSRLEQLGHTYGCACSRREIADNALPCTGENIYPGTCRYGLPPGRKARAIRLQVYDREISIEDRLQGRLRQLLGNDVGDFVIRRADHLVAYQLAVVVDDALQEITHVVRGTDLFNSTPRQVYLQRLLGYSQPEYLHLPVAVGRDKEKLSKQSHAQAIDPANGVALLRDALTFLNQPLPDAVCEAGQNDLMHWAIEHWDSSAVPAVHSIQAADTYSD